MPDNTTVHKSDYFPNELTIFFTPDLVLMDAALDGECNYIYMNIVRDIAKEALLSGGKISCDGICNQQVCGYAIAEVLTCQNTGKAYAIGVYMRYTYIRGAA